MTDQRKVRTCLWFNSKGHEAAAFYVSLLPGSFVEDTSVPREGEEPLVVAFTLAGAPFMILNGGPAFAPTPAASISVRTADQDETDRLWERLVANGGKESMCGWLTDRYGVSWQIVPDALPRLLSSENTAAAARAKAAMLKMHKIDIAALEAAFAGQ